MIRVSIATATHKLFFVKMDDLFLPDVRLSHAFVPRNCHGYYLVSCCPIRCVILRVIKHRTLATRSSDFGNESYEYRPIWTHLIPITIMYWSKVVKYLTRCLFSNIKLFLPHRKENIKWFFLGRTGCNQFLVIYPNTQEKLKKIGQCFQVALQFDPRHPLPNIINTNLSVLVGYLLAKLNHHFNVSIDISMVFGHTE